MAIWQYKLFSIPEEELKSYFNNVNYVPIEAFDRIEWWKYRTYNSVNFSSFSKLSFQKSWSKDIKQLGDIDSDCVEILVKGEEIIEISMRIDLRKNYKPMVECICEFGRNNQLCFLNNENKLLFSIPDVINQDINDYKLLNQFISKFGE